MWAPYRLAASEVWALLLGTALFIVVIFVSSRSRGDVRYPSSNPSEEV